MRTFSELARISGMTRATEPGHVLPFITPDNPQAMAFVALCVTELWERDRAKEKPQDKEPSNP